MANQRGTIGFGKVVSDRIKIDMDDTIHMLDPNATPFTLLLEKLGSETPDNPEFYWMEDDYVGLTNAVDGVVAAGGTTKTITLLSTLNFRINDIVMFPSVDSKTYLITDFDDTAKTIDVLLIGAGTIPEIADTSVIMRIGNAFPEGTNKRAILQTQEVAKYNYTQIFKHTFGVTNTAKNGQFYGGPLLASQRKKAGVEFAIEKERTFWWGRRDKDTDSTSGQPQRYMNGVLAIIETDGVEKDNGAAAMSKTIFDNWLAQVFLHGSEERYIFCSEYLINFISGLSVNQLQTVMGQDTYGIAITEYITPAGKRCYLINNNRVFDTSPYDYFAVALDLSKVKRQTFRPVMLETNIQENGEDTEIDQYISEESLKLVNPECHGWIHNFTVT